MVYRGLQATSRELKSKKWKIHPCFARAGAFSGGSGNFWNRSLPFETVSRPTPEPKREAHLPWAGVDRTAVIEHYDMCRSTLACNRNHNNQKRYVNPIERVENPSGNEKASKVMINNP
jgi:hypothetical protein